MRTPIDAKLRDEARRFALRFTCVHCVHFNTEQQSCANEYPTQAHLHVDLDQQESLEFCKEFELA